MDIESLRSRHFKTHVLRFSHKDVILYHLGVGCSMAADGPHCLYEGCGLRVLPTYAIVAAHPSIYSIPLHEYIPGCKMVSPC